MKVLSIAKYELIKLFRNKTVLLIMIALPVAFTFVMALAFGSADAPEERKIPVGIVINDSSELVYELISGVKKDRTINVIEMEESELFEKVKNTGIEAGFIIPDDFTAKISKGGIPQIQTVKLPVSVAFRAAEGVIRAEYSRMLISEAVRTYFEDKLGGMDISERVLIIEDIAYEIEKNLNKPPVISVREAKIYGEEESTDFNGKTYSSIGIAVMFAMFTIVFGAGEILEDKKNNTWGRLLTTPVHKSEIMAGKVLGTFLRGWVQISILILLGQFVLGVEWGNSLHATFIVFSIYILSITSMGMFMSSIVKTNSQLGAYSSIIIVSTSMLAGCYWPLEIVPEFMQKIAMLFPQYWAIKALNNTVSANLGMSSVIEPLTVLALMGLIFYLLSFVGEMLKSTYKKSIQGVK